MPGQQTTVAGAELAVVAGVARAAFPCSFRAAAVAWGAGAGRGGLRTDKEINYRGALATRDEPADCVGVAGFYAVTAAFCPR